MIRRNCNRDGQNRSILRSRVDSDDGGLQVRDAAPVDTQEEALLGVARRDGALGMRDVQPRRVARSGEGKGVRPAGGDVDVPISGREVWVDGEDRVAAAVALSAIVHVVSGPTRKSCCVQREGRGAQCQHWDVPGPGAAFDRDAHGTRQCLFLRLHLRDGWHPENDYDELL